MAVAELGEVALKQDAAEAAATKRDPLEAATTLTAKRVTRTKKTRGSRRRAPPRASTEGRHRCPPMER